MLTLASWWPQAQALADGQKRRVQHDCGEGNILLVSRSPDGYRAWCFRCNDGGSQPAPAESLADKLARMERQRAGDLAVSASPGLPLPAVLEPAQWPLDARVWLYRAGLSNADIGKLGVYYHPPSDRVVLPVLEAGVPVFYQARAYQKGRAPKYLGPTPRPPKLLPRWGRAPVPTLTEDILSAIKIGMVAEGWAVLGTKVSDHMIAALLRRGSPVNVWLDPDAAGRKGAAKIVKQLRAYGLEVRDIVSTRDPKLHTLEEIREHTTARSETPGRTVASIPGGAQG